MDKWTPPQMLRLFDSSDLFLTDWNLIEYDKVDNNCSCMQPLVISEKKLGDAQELSERELYERLCRGEVKMSPAKEAKLKCRYVHKDNPFLYLARLQEEEASLSPRIVLYHSVLSDAEIATIKHLAQPRVWLLFLSFLI